MTTSNSKMLAGNDENHSIDERLYCVSEATDFLPPKKSELVLFCTNKNAGRLYRHFLQAD